jgi:MarR family 2-MHQ and catechol resistance regulon transcriptional repressor
MSSLQFDADALYEAATAFIRLYQFRSRDTALKFGLTVAQAYTLDVLLACGGTSLNGVAEALRLDKSTTSRIVSGMARAGLVDWTRSEDDQRAKRIVASREGKRRYGNLRRAIVRDNARLLASYAPNARKTIITALWQLTNQGSGIGDQGSGIRDQGTRIGDRAQPPDP